MIKLFSGLTILILVGLLIGGCAPPNQPPLISSLIASQERAYPSGSCQVQCFAWDPNGDELSYIWSATDGSISGEGPEITWTAPATPGDYIITVTVTDDRGGEITGQLTIAVAINQPPVITELTAKQQTVKKAATTIIQCFAQDPDEDELSYTWSTTGGSISGAGNTVTWVAPNNYGIYTITVIVTDGWGGQATQDIDMVVTCSCEG